MAYILNIETSTSNCSVCLSNDNSLVAIRENANGYDHAKLLTVFIEELLSDAGISMQQLDAVAVSEGPGSYTGLRIGTSVAKGICFATDIPLIAVSTLETIASALQDKYPEINRYMPVMDSRKNEIYFSIYDNHLNIISQIEAIDVKELKKLKEVDKEMVIAGTGINKLRYIGNLDYIIFDEEVFYSSQNMIKRSFVKYKVKDYKNLIYFEPLYLKDVFITKGKNPLTIKR